MKKVYDFEQKIHIKGQMDDFHDTSIWNHYRLCSDDYVVEKEGRWCFPTFSDLWDYLENSAGILNTEHWTNCFGKRKIRFKCGMNFYTITEKHYQPVTLWHHFSLADKVCLKTLMENLPADEMVEYLKERGLGLDK